MSDAHDASPASGSAAPAAAHGSTPLLPLRHGPATGEAMVWLTAMGLAAGLTMVLLLLGTVFLNGIGVFWPSRIERIERVDVGGKVAEVTGGVLVERRMKRAPGQRHIEEVQIFTGNRNAQNPGTSYRWIDAAGLRMQQTDDVLMIERTQWGFAIGAPVALRLADGTAIPATAADFPSQLNQAIGRAEALRDAIERIEKREIGRLNTRQKHLVEERDLAQSRGTLSSAEAAQVARELATIQAEFARLDPERMRLRGQLDDETLTIREFSGRSTDIVTGELIDAYYANRLGVGDRCLRFVSNVWAFLTHDPREANTEGGIFPAIVGTFVMTLLMSLAVVPFGVLAAIWLREYAKQGPLVRIVRICVNNLAGVPSIVFGVFGLGFFVYIVGGQIDALFYPAAQGEPVFRKGTLIWAALTLALMTVPVVIVATEEALSAVPRGQREASLAIGASKWQTIQRIVLPSAVPGILTGLILAMARGAGEVAPLMLVGVVKLAPTLPIDGSWDGNDLVPFVHLQNQFMHLGFHIYDVGFQSPDSEAAKPMVYATTLVLIGLVLALNLGAIWLRERLRRRFATGAF